MNRSVFTAIAALFMLIILGFAACSSEIEPILESIAVTRGPDKKEYLIGESLSLAGMEVTAAYSNGSREKVSGYTVSDFDSQEFGLKKITVSYNDKTADFAVAVVGDINEVKLIVISGGPDKVEYLVGEELDIGGLEVTAIYNDNSTAVVLDYTVAIPDNTLPGLKNLMVYYGAGNTWTKLTYINKGIVPIVEVLAGGARRFNMGSNDTPAGTYTEMTGRETPVHQVLLICFYIGKYPVTQAQYMELMGTNPSYFSGDNLPVHNVSWYDAVEFCNKLSEAEGLVKAYTINKGTADPNNTNSEDSFKWTVTTVDGANGYRLPTEAEWEYACRAGTSTPYNVPTPSGGGVLTKDQANFDSGGPAVVGSYAPNALGIYDMHGNVWEWCGDWFSEAYYSAPPPLVHPLGPTSGEYRVIRGGAWDSPSAALLRSSCRGFLNQGQKYNYTGFRVLRAKYPDSDWAPSS